MTDEGPGDTRVSGPPETDRGDHDSQECRPKQGGDDNAQDEGRQGHDHVRDSHHDHVNGASGISREETEAHADGQAEGQGQDSGGE